MKRETLFTGGAVASVLTASALIFQSPSSPPVESPAAPTTQLVDRSIKANRVASVNSNDEKASQPDRDPIDWRSAPYALSSDLFAAVIQPRQAVGSEDFEQLQELLGDNSLRDLADRTEWIVVYGQAAERNTDFVRTLSYVVKQAAPTTALDLAIDRFEGREATEAVQDGIEYVRVAPASETVLVEKQDDQGNSTNVETVVEHPAMAVVRHDSQTFLIVPESELLDRYRSTGTSSLKDVLHEANSSDAVAFALGGGQQQALASFAGLFGDRSSLLMKPVLALLKGATGVSASAGLGPDHLVQMRITFPAGDSAAQAAKGVTTLRDQTVSLLEDAGSVASTTSIATGLQLLKAMSVAVDGAAVRVTLPRPVDLKSLFVAEKPAATSRS
jgi:hypothetical protein